MSRDGALAEATATGAPAAAPRSVPLGRWISGAALLLILAAHLWQIDEIPAGLYVDESSIGLNAAAILSDGRDEHGRLLPLYFQAFGEYKNPVYVYTTALLFGVLGPSPLALRMSSFLFLAAALLIGMLLVRRMFPRQPEVRFFALLSFGFVPLLFVLSRVAFEVVSSVTLFLAVLLATHAAFVARDGGRSELGYPLALGLLLGLWLYSYSTIRMSAGLTLAAVIAVFAARAEPRALRLVILAFLLAAIPLALILVTEPTALLGRFKAISYWDEPVSLTEKLQRFGGIYLQHWAPDFLLREGDGQPRHGGGLAGIVFVSTLGLAGVGALAIGLGQPGPERRFGGLLLMLTLLAPVPAAMTGEDVPNALRAHLLAPCLVLLSFYGFVALLRLLPSRRAVVALLLNGLLATEAGLFVRAYFTGYPVISVAAMGGLGAPEVVAAAVAQRPERIVLVPQSPASYAVLRFALIDLGLTEPSLTIEEVPVYRPQTCYIHYPPEEPFAGFPEPRLSYRPDFSVGALGIREGGPMAGALALRCH